MSGDPSRDEGLLRANGDMRMNGEGGHDEEDDEQERPDQTLLTRMRPGGESQSQFGDS
jgi:hypothetical protein